MKKLELAFIAVDDFRSVDRLGLNSLATREAGFGFVPPLDLFWLAELPTEQNDAAIAKARKVYESAVVVFELDTKFGEIGRQLSDLIKCLYVCWTSGHTAAAGVLRSRTGVVSHRAQPFVQSS
jgi:hypothetical protein